MSEEHVTDIQPVEDLKTTKKLEARK